MGNCLSAKKDTVSLRDLVGRPGVAPPELPMSVDTIWRGLTSVAATLHSKGQNVSIFVVLGAVNTLLLLHTRESTGDVDFFYRTKTKNEEVTKVIVAAGTAATKLTNGWINHTAVFFEVLKSAWPVHHCPQTTVNNLNLGDQHSEHWKSWALGQMRSFDLNPSCS